MSENLQNFCFAKNHTKMIRFTSIIAGTDDKDV